MTTCVGVLGATGGTGEQVIQRALKAGYRVVALARRPDAVTVPEGEGADRFESRFADVRDIGSLVTALEGIDILVGTYGVAGLKNAFKPTDLYSAGTRNVIRAMEEVGLSRLVMVSSSGLLYAESSPWVWNRIIRAQCWRMYADMFVMEILISESSLDWTIVRPPQLIDGDELKVEARIDAAPDGPSQLTRAALGQFLVENLDTDKYRRKRVTVSHSFHS